MERNAMRIGTVMAMVAGLLLTAGPAHADDGLTNDDGTAFALQVCDLGLVSLLGIDLSDCNTGSDDRRDSRIHEEDRDGWVFVKNQDRRYVWRR